MILLLFSFLFFLLALSTFLDFEIPFYSLFTREVMEEQPANSEEESASMRIYHSRHALMDSRGGSERQWKDYRVLSAGRGILIPILNMAANRAGSWSYYIHLHGILIWLFLFHLIANMIFLFKRRLSRDLHGGDNSMMHCGETSLSHMGWSGRRLGKQPWHHPRFGDSRSVSVLLSVLVPVDLEASLLSVLRRHFCDSSHS